jgi:hypothetical protein
MLVSVLEVALVAVVGLCLLAPWLRGAVRRVWPTTADAAGAGERGRPAAAGDAVRRRWAGRIGGILFAIAIMNFLAFSVHTRSLGGSAGNGKRVDGRYYVGAHGRYTEVTERQWREARAHEVAVFVTHPLGLQVGGPLLFYSQRRRGQAEAEPSAAPDPARM